jgi:lysophospholipase L1-like esterase
MQKYVLYPLIGALLIIGAYSLYMHFHQPQIKNYPPSGTDIIAFGDSLVEGVGATLGNDLVSTLSKNIGVPIVNLGHSGDTTADGYADIF